MANVVLQFKKKTSAEFAAIENKVFGTFYMVTDDGGATGQLYFGAEKISNAQDLANAITRIGVAEGKIGTLEGTVAKLDGDENTNGSVRKLLAEAVSGINDLIGEVPSGSTLVDLIDAGGSSVVDLENAIGDVPEGHTVMGDIAANASAIATLNGDAQTAGSIEHTVREAIAAVIASVPTDFDTLKEIADWISSHASSATAMNTAIQSNASAISAANSAIASNASAIAANASAISAHEEFVGASLPASTSATTVIGYVQESFQKCEDMIGSIPSTASASNLTDYINEVVDSHQIFWTED